MDNEEFKPSDFTKTEKIFYNWRPGSPDTIHFLRFYSDGLVIAVSINENKIEDLSEVLKWFNKDNIDIDLSKGFYRMNGNEIAFDLKSGMGIVKYSGRILNENELKLDIVSLINRYMSEDEHYYRVTGNKVDPSTFKNYR